MPTTTAPAPPASGPAAATLDPRRWLALALLAVAQFVVVLDASIMNIALPSIGTELHVSTDTLSWVVNAYVLAFGGLLLLGGRLADLLGRRRVFIAGLVVFGLASLAGGLSANATQLIAARAIQGIGAAALAPAALSIVTTLFGEGAERNKALGIWGAVAGSGGVAGVLLGGILTSGLGWEWVLFVNVPIALGAAVLAPRLFGESRVGDGARSIDVAGAVTVTGGIVAAVYALVQANDAGWTSLQTLGLLGAAAVLLGAFVAIEARVAEPLMPLDIFRAGPVRAANVTMVAAGAAMFGLFFFLSLYLQQVLGYSALEAGVSQLPLAGTLVLAAGLAGPLAQRFGIRPLLLAGLALFALGMAWFSRIPVDGAFLPDILGPSLLVGLGLALTFVALTIAAVTGVDDRRYGLASGLINTSQQIGGALGLAILTAVADHRTQTSAAGGLAAINDGYRLALLVAAGLAGVALVAAALLAPRARA
ncbi:MAG: transporter [Conexibacter sp.]|nr:transporter [Conexibacter sp.]